MTRVPPEDGAVSAETCRRYLVNEKIFNCKCAFSWKIRYTGLSEFLNTLSFPNTESPVCFLSWWMEGDAFSGKLIKPCRFKHYRFQHASCHYPRVGWREVQSHHHHHESHVIRTCSVLRGTIRSTHGVCSCSYSISCIGGRVAKFKQKKYFREIRNLKSGEEHNVSLESSLIAHIPVHLLLLIISTVWRTNKTSMYNCTHEMAWNMV